MFYRSFEADIDYFDNNLITNFKKEKEPLFRKAIEMYGWDGLYISDEAYWKNGIKDDSMKSLRTKNPAKDLSDFWRIYDKLIEKMG